MKKFISANWYKLMIGSSLLMASFGFLIRSLPQANANGLNSMIPVNADGSISVKLSDAQLKALTPTAIQGVNIQQIDGLPAATYITYDMSGNKLGCLGVSLSNR